MLTWRSKDYMVWNTGTVDDFNRLAHVTGDPNWDWAHVHPLIKKVRPKERNVEPCVERSHEQPSLDREAYATSRPP